MNIFTPNNITFILGSLGILFGIYNYFRSPQISSEKQDIRFRAEIDSLKSEIKEIKDTHLKTLEAKIESLTSGINELSKTVVKLATIVDERIPRQQNK